MPQYEQKRNLDWRMKLRAAGVPILPPAEIGYKLIGTLIRFGWNTIRRRIGWNGLCRTAIRKMQNQCRSTDSKRELSCAGIPVPEQTVVRSAEELRDACRVFGYPLVLKINSPDILHKTEAGGVRAEYPHAGGS